jgi:D-hexose-6-phosphate mutarotase
VGAAALLRPPPPQISVKGLDGVTYTDSLAGGARVVQAGAVTFDREVDRIYLAAPDSAMKVGEWVCACSAHQATRE